MPRSRTKNKHIRTFSLSGQCLERLARHQLSHEPKSYLVERLLMSQMDFLERVKANRPPFNHCNNTHTAPLTPSNDEPHWEPITD